MKKTIGLVTALAMMLTLLVGCGGSAVSGTTSSGTSTGTTSGTEPGAPAGDVVEYTIATSIAPGDSIALALDFFAEECEKRSGGTLKGETFHNGTLGSQRDYIDGMQMGSIQVAESSTSLLAGIEPKFSIFDMPYISPSVEYTMQVLDSGVGEKLSEALEQSANVKIVGWIIRTPRNVYSSKGPIEKPEDFKGLKIRTMESAPVMRAMELLGAKPSPIPGTERYMALQTKVVDAAENSSAEILMKKEYEVTQYLSKTAHLIQPNPICVDKNFFDSLSPEQQKIMLEVGAEAGKYGTSIEVDNLQEVEKQLEEKGMKINEIEDLSAFVEIVQPVYDEYVDEFGQDILDAFLKS